MDTRGKHLIAEYYGCDSKLLNDESALKQLLLEAALAANVRVIDSIQHSFSPVGVTCVVAIEESHLSLHTWPEEAYAAADFFTCGDGSPDAAHKHLINGLKAKRVERLLLDRGIRNAERSVQILEHHVETQE